MIDYNIDMDALQLVLNRYSCLLNTQSDFKLIWITTIGAIFASGVIFAVKHLRDMWLREQEELRETGFGFYLKEGKEKDTVALDLRNIGKNEVKFDPQKGIYMLWPGEYHRIDLHENNISSIPFQGGSTQLNYEVNLNDPQKRIINSKKFRFFIYTSRGKRFELLPSDAQLKKWNRMTMEQWKKGVEEIKDRQEKTNWIVILIRKLQSWHKNLQSCWIVRMFRK